MQKIDRGLAWLERTQRQDGSWSSGGATFGGGGYPMVMTSLAAMAMMANGSTPESGPYSRSVARALNWALNAIESNNKEGDKNILITSGGMEGRSMYGHGFGMLFLAQCYGVEGGQDLAARAADQADPGRGGGPDGGGGSRTSARRSSTPAGGRTRRTPRATRDR